jgi:anaerobic ribonucleoside-triphosphate reductase activating protein
MTDIRISSIVKNSVVDGEGVRTVLYMQGCSIACPGCQNKAIWDKLAGTVLDTKDLAAQLVAMSTEHHNYTIQGGEPTEQTHALQVLMSEIRHLDPDAHITLYSGHTWETLMKLPVGVDIIHDVDVLVDGPFIASQDDPFILWRGSRNQRPIDVKATIEAGHVVTLDWDAPRIIIDTDGTLKMPVGLVQDFEELGDTNKSRRCGDWKS